VKAYIVTMLLLMGIESIGKLRMVHRIIEGDGPIPRKPAELLTDVGLSIGFIAWGVYVLS